MSSQIFNRLASVRPFVPRIKTRGLLNQNLASLSAKSLSTTSFAQMHKFQLARPLYDARYKSTLAVDDDESTSTFAIANDDNTIEAETEIIAEKSLLSATENNELDYTSDKTKSGTPSPWAVFDAWGAGAGINPPIDPADEAKLSYESVKISTSEDLIESTDETEILKAYDNLLKQRSSVHFGYPYNLMVS